MLPKILLSVLLQRTLAFRQGIYSLACGINEALETLNDRFMNLSSQPCFSLLTEN